MTQVTSINQSPCAYSILMGGGWGEVADLLLPPVPKPPPNRSPLFWCRQSRGTTIPAPFSRQESRPRRQRMGNGASRAEEPGVGWGGVVATKLVSTGS